MPDWWSPAKEQFFPRAFGSVFVCIYVCVCVYICVSVYLPNARESIKLPVSSVFISLNVNDSPLRTAYLVFHVLLCLELQDMGVRLC